VFRESSMPYSTIDSGPERVFRFDTTHGLRDGVFTVGRFAEQQARWHINNAGWASDIDYLPPEQRTLPLIAIIGDSYIEGFAVDPNENVGARLWQKLVGRADVYTFGKSGAAMSEYLAMARYVRRIYRPEVIIVNIVHNDLHESVRNVVPAPEFTQLTEKNGSFEVAPPLLDYGVTRSRRLLRASALLRYLVVNLQALETFNTLRDRLRKREANANVYIDLVAKNRDVSTRAARYLAHKFAEENRDTTLIFMIDAPREDIYKGHPQTSNVRWMNEAVRDAAAANGITFVDLTGPMSAEYARAGVKFNSEVDHHWNAAGHRIAADAVYRAITTVTPLR
jgi:lysophospholipase L1-like esterase